MAVWEQSLWEIGLFAVKTLLIVGSIAFLLLLAAANAIKGSVQSPTIEIKPIHEKLENIKILLQEETLEKDELKAIEKAEKAKKKAEKKNPPTKALGKTYVLDFKGDLKASAVEQLREEITALLTIATPTDEVIVKVNSPGGVVHGYGLAASQLLRIKEQKIPLTVCVDEVAASGGYMMACTADKIRAAPFAILGSIGVVAQVPNFHRLLKKNEVDYKEYTAGDYKRTVSLFGEITEKGEQKFLDQLQETHVLFKNFVGQLRPQLDMDQVATGEYWFGKDALDLKLCDELGTSDELIFKKAQAGSVYSLCLQKKKSMIEKLSSSAAQAFENATYRIWNELVLKKWFT